MLVTKVVAFAQNGIVENNTAVNGIKELSMTSEWDKTFPKSDKVEHKKITFHNRFGITLVADMYTPKNVSGKLPAIAVSGPFGAVKEQRLDSMHRHLPNVDFLPLPSTPLSLARAVVNLAMLPLPT